MYILYNHNILNEVLLFLNCNDRSKHEQCFMELCAQKLILLFLIYINDLPSVTPIFHMLMYADDTTLYCNLNGVNFEVTINNELSKISEWLSSNKLSLNIKKTKFMVFHTPQRRVNYPVLKLNNVNIERVSQFNFLGVVINSTLKWDKHIAHISLKISRATSVIFRLRHIYPREIL